MQTFWGILDQFEGFKGVKFLGGACNYTQAEHDPHLL